MSVVREATKQFLQHCRDEAWKLGGLLLFVCAGLAGHYDILPDALQPWRDWIEFAGFVGGLVNTWRMQPPQKKDGGT